MPNLVPYSFTALVSSDPDGDNIGASQSISVKFDYDGTLATIYSDAAGTTPISQPASTDSNGVLEFWVSAGRYRVESGGRTEYVVIDDGSMLKLTTSQVATSKHLRIGDVVLITDRADSLWDIGSYTANGMDILEATGSGLQARLRIDYLNMNVEQFGAVGSGDETTVLQRVLDLAATGNGSVYSEAGKTYTFSTLMIKNGTKKVDFTQSVLLPDGSTDPTALTTEAAVVLDGINNSGTAVDNCIVALNIDMQNGDRTAILGDGCTRCSFVRSKIYGFTDDATYNHRGIRLQEGATGNWVLRNEIEGVANPIQRGLLVDLYASLTGFNNFGGFFTGTISRQPTPVKENIVQHNRFIDGSYSVNLQGGEYNNISNNYCNGQNHRGMWLGNGSFYNTISSNIIIDFSSAGILMAYGCCHNEVSDNMLYNNGTTGLSGEGGIVAYTGSSNNLIADNKIDAPVNYSVYIATDSSSNVIQGNDSYNAYLAAFAVENDWKDTLPTNANYSRPNYGDPTTLEPPISTSWTYNNLVNTVFESNTVHYGYTGRNICAFSVAQIRNSLAGATATQLIGVTFNNNKVLSATNIGKILYLYEQNSGDLQQVKFNNGVFDSAITGTTTYFSCANTSSGTLNIKTHGLVYAKNNGVMDEQVQGTAVDFADADTTPSVAHWNYFRFNNSGATSVTDFDDASEGKEIILRGDANTTIVYTSGLIRPKGLVDVTGMSANSLIGFKSIGGIWYESFRNF